MRSRLVHSSLLRIIYLYFGMADAENYVYETFKFS